MAVAPEMAAVMPEPEPEQPTIVVLGGGFAGQSTLKTLKKQPGFGTAFSVTVVQPHPFVEAKIAMPAYLADPERFAATVNKRKGGIASLDRAHVSGVRYVIGVATAVTATSVELAGGQSLRADAVVACVGAYHPFISAAPAGESLEARIACVRGFAPTVAAANSIVVGGGGPVAVEMVATLREINQAAKIKLVTSAARVCPEWEGSAAEALDRRLRALDIEVNCEERISGDASLETTKIELSGPLGRRTVETDVYLPMFARLNTGFITESVEGSTDAAGLVKVDGKQQSEVLPQLFAVGCSTNSCAEPLPAVCRCARMRARLACRPLGADASHL